MARCGVSWSVFAADWGSVAARWAGGAASSMSAGLPWWVEVTVEVHLRCLEVWWLTYIECCWPGREVIDDFHLVNGDRLVSITSLDLITTAWSLLSTSHDRDKSLVRLQAYD